ncbi:MAG TPA: PDZ domain-containing protein [Thermoanaerobaculaceae bacterium]|nr:PDZ domain-containing protein [Thermoanaerobaculaceae bacterium]HRS15859.1 PDZ domain-containing protein [Thermoanaerobaculaceae bacterium]
MNTRHITALVAAGLLAFAGTVRAQDSTTDDAARRAAEKARQKAEEQMRKAELEMQEAQRKLREAERKLREAAREIAQTTRQAVQKELWRKVVVFGDHPRIGVILRSEADPRVDVIGAEVQGVTPGGPAEEAGVKIGDVIVKINGKILTTPFIEVEVDADESAPAARLREAVAQLADGDKVELVVKRGSELKTLELTARRMGGPLVGMWTDKGRSFDFDFDFDGKGTGGHRTLVVRDWLDLELTSLNPELGEYFGASEGVLVTRAPRDDSLKLRAGDVILKVGDRPATSPSRVLRLLRSYDPGETAAIEVLRKKERLTLLAKIPEGGRRGFVWAPAPDAPPAPPEAPEPPAPPARPPRGKTR